MKITVYPFLHTSDGESIHPEPQAVIVWEDGKTSIDAEDKQVEKMLADFYSKPLLVRRAVSPQEGVVAFKEVEIFPGTEEFFRESAYLLRLINFFGKLEGDKKMQLIALDFDGTLWDSVEECFVLTCQAFQKLGWPLPQAENLKEKFKAGRGTVRVGEEFYRLLKWIGDHPGRDPSNLSSEEEASLHQTDGSGILFEKIFYALRKEWREQRFKEWCALQKPYPGILDQVRIVQRQFSRVVIATTKDADSVRKLLSLHDIALDVVGKENTVDKAKQMHLISSTYRKPLSQIVFVDDILDQVRLVKSIGVKTALAGWGYSSARQKDEARKLGIPVLDLETLADSLSRLF